MNIKVFTAKPTGTAKRVRRPRIQRQNASEVKSSMTWERIAAECRQVFGQNAVV